MLDLMIMLADDPTPQENDVVAGPLGFALWIFLILAVVVLGFSLVKQLRKAQAAKDAGLYGDEPVDPASDTESAERTDTDR
jgi:type III secretory pathway component EscV